MKLLTINNSIMKKKYQFIIFALFVAFSRIAVAQEATLKIDFAVEDSVKMCNVHATSSDSSISGVEVKLYVKRLFSLLPIGEGETTDEEGNAKFVFPSDIPADLNGKIEVIAKVEDDENYGSTEAKVESNWCVPRKEIGELERSLAGSRENAPIYFIVVSNLIIIGIWGTLVYVVLQLFKLRRSSKRLSKK